jgi:hypothetical protein
VGQAEPTQRGRTGTLVRRGVLGTCAVLAAVAGGWLSLPAGAAGILPPNNPPANIAPSSPDFVTSIDTARAAEGVGPMDVSESVVSSLPVDEQAFIIINEERINRGLPPIAYVTAQLNADAQQGADADDDPGFPSALTGGSGLTWGGSVWAGGLTSVLGADYYWMYSDGFGGAQSETTNADCSTSTSSECWGHRDILLHEFDTCGTAAPTLAMGAAATSGGSAGGSIAAVLVSTCGAPPSDIVLTWSGVEASVFAPPQIIGLATLDNGQGYWEAESTGGVAAFGAAADYGSMADTSLNSPVVGIEATPDGQGYWLVAADGGIFAFGDAHFYGSTGSLHLVAPIVGMAPTSDGLGYWLVAADGGVFSFGDAAFHGSMGGVALNQPIVDMAADPATDGYWLVAADGGIFSFGAPFFGSTGAVHLDRPIVGMEALTNGQGYRFEAADGGVFCFGAATFAGSMGGHALVAPVVGMAADPAANGYWLVASDGGIFSFGAASYYGRITG